MQADTSKLIGYARVSTEDQNLDMQIDALTKAGVRYSDIYQEKISALARKRPRFEALKQEIREGDTLVVWKLDRVGRSMRDIKALVEDLIARKVNFRSLTEHLDTTGPVGMLTLHIIAAVAEFELQMIRSRTKAGLQSAKAQGRVGGRRVTVPDEVIEQWKHLGPKAGAQKVGLSKAQFIRRVARLEARG